MSRSMSFYIHTSGLSIIMHSDGRIRVYYVWTNNKRFLNKKKKEHITGSRARPRCFQFITDSLADAGLNHTQLPAGATVKVLLKILHTHVV